MAIREETVRDYTQVSIRRTYGDEWFVSIGLWRADGSHRKPRLVKKPWEHQLYLPSSVTQEEVFAAVRHAIEKLADPA
jgi:hypothetical protein